MRAIAKGAKEDFANAVENGQIMRYFAMTTMIKKSTNLK